MRRTNIFLLPFPIILLCMTACGSTQQLIDTDTIKEAGKPNDFDLNGHDQLCCFIPIQDYDNNGTPLFSDTFHAAAENGVLSVDFYSVIKTVDKNPPEYYHAVLTANVNGTLYDFSADGQSSIDGLFELDLPVNGERTIPFQISNCSMNKGENLLQVSLFTYNANYHETNHVYYDVVFTSKDEYKAKSAVPVTEIKDIKDVKTEKVNGRSIEELTPTPTSIIAEQYLTSEYDDNGIVKVKKDSPLQFQLFNLNENEGPSNRIGYSFAFSNGKPLKVWNGNAILKTEMSESEFELTIPGHADFPENERTDISFVYVGSQNDKQNPYTQVQDRIGSYFFVN